MKKLIEAIACLAVIALVILIIIVSAWSFILWINSWKQPKEGFIEAQIVSVQRVGFIWKSTELYLKSNQQASNQYKFCVLDEALVDKLKSLSANPDKTYRFSYRNGIHYPIACYPDSISVLRSVN